MKKFLVTGATGFLGTHLVDALLRRFADCSDLTSIRILSRGGNPWNENPRIEVFHGDILNAGAVDRAVESVSGIFHLAGFVTRNPANGADLYQTHVQGTRNICESALTHGGPRVVVVSSSGTIAVSRQPKIHNEDSLYSNDVVAFWPYYLSKIYQEKLALSYHALKELPVVIVNPSLLLGPRDERFSSTGDVRLFLAGKVTNIPFGGLNFVDVRDAAEALIQAMLAGLPGRRYLVGGYNMTLAEFFSMIQRVSGVRAPRFSIPERWSRRGARVLRALYSWFGGHFPLDDTTVEMAYRFWYLDNSRAKAELGLTTRPPEVTLRDTVEYLRRQKLATNFTNYTN